MLNRTSNVQVGINSYSNGHCTTQTLDVYTRVSYYEAWIREQICSFSSNPPEYCLPPSTHPSNDPSSSPSNIPSDIPSDVPSNAPTGFPSILQTGTTNFTNGVAIAIPTASSSPSTMPTNLPSKMPSQLPTRSKEPSQVPSKMPTLSPSNAPSQATKPPISKPSSSASSLASPVMSPTRMPIISWGDFHASYSEDGFTNDTVENTEDLSLDNIAPSPGPQLTEETTTAVETDVGVFGRISTAVRNAVDFLNPFS